MTSVNETANRGSQASEGRYSVRFGVLQIDNITGLDRGGHYRKDPSNCEGETVDDDVSAVLVRGTEGLEEKLDPSTSKS